MKLSTHRAITRSVARALDIDGAVLEAMLRGVAEPDASPERELTLKVGRSGRMYLVERRVHHHTTANRGRILKRLWRARTLWLEGRRVEAAYDLGYALHYIQDMCVRRGSHEADEAAIRGVPVPERAIREAILRAKPSPSFLERVLRELEPSPPPLAVERAAAASAMAAASVVADPRPPLELLEAVKAGEPRHRLLSLIALASLLTSTLTLFSAPLISFAALACAVAAYALDGGYRKLKKELKWFRNHR